MSKRKRQVNQGNAKAIWMMTNETTITTQPKFIDCITL